MAYPMIALTTDGTSFACASISLTETGLAVLDDDGSRNGFVPFDSLAYVAPTEEARVTEAPMQVRIEDGSTFGAASLSQTGAGVAVLDHSGSRIGFVPYDTLTHVLPESKTGPTLPADATPPAGVEIDEEDDGGSPVWEGDRERSDEHGEDAEDESEDDNGSGADRSGNDNDSDPHPGADDGDETDDSGGVWGDPVDQSERDESDGTDKSGDAGGDQSAAPSDGPDEGGEDAPDEQETKPCGCPVGTECDCAESGSSADGGAEGGDSEAPAGAENGEREEAEESELVVEWSFGDDE